MFNKNLQKEIIRLEKRIDELVIEIACNKKPFLFKEGDKVEANSVTYGDFKGVVVNKERDIREIHKGYEVYNIYTICICDSGVIRRGIYEQKMHLITSKKKKKH
jgi:hypothetical protein